MDVSAHRLVTRLEMAALRGVMIAMAAGTALVGVSLLTTPIAVPVVVGLWLGAVGMFALGVWGHPPGTDA
jgi:hypothetical protein